MSAHLVASIRDRAAAHPQQVALTFLSDRPGQPDLVLSYGDIDRRARSVAAALQHRAPTEGAHGTRAMLVFAPGADFIVGYLGCLYAGVVAVPVSAPHPAQLASALKALDRGPRPAPRPVRAAAPRRSSSARWRRPCKP